MKTIVTTGGRPDEAAWKLAQAIAIERGCPAVERKKASVKKMMQLYEANVLIAGKDRFEWYPFGAESPFFFHPNSAAFRVKRLQRGGMDPLIEIAGLQDGDSFLDCTLGLASDSITASFIAGESGKVLGIEANPDIAFLTAHGLKRFGTESEELRNAMSRIKVETGQAEMYLRGESDGSWDVVYIDPMFSAPIEESSNFTALRTIGVHSVLTESWMNEAVRVCRRRVVVKDRFDSPVFTKFGLHQIVRPNTKFHYGFIDVREKTPASV